jgi:MoaA/NifB/PqqE/SkfB family radical SAM enzyme
VDFSRLWGTLPPDVLDFLLRRDVVRKMALEKGKQKLYDYLVIVNEDNRPKGVQLRRTRLLQNLLEAVNKAYEQGRVSPHVTRAIIGNLVGSTILREKERTHGFVQKYGFPPPHLLTISPTKKCNLFCKGCYAASSAGNSETLTAEVLNRIIKEKKQLWGSYLTVITGGEPLLYKDDGKGILDIFEQNNDSYFMMYTNGTLITREVARRMAQLGNVTPAISIEGFQKETDGRRGEGVYRRILQAMENLRSEGVPFGISMTATRHNAEVLLSDELIDFYFEHQGAIYAWLFQYMPIGRSYTVDLMVTPEQRVKMFQREQYLIKERNIFLVDFWNGGPYSHGCISAGRTGGYFFIDWNGNIAPCVFFPYYVSNIYDVYREDKTLDDVLFSPYFESIRTWQNLYGYAQPPRKVGNFVTPCPMRDHHDVGHSIIKRFKARPMDENAAAALEDAEYRERMRQYGREITSLTQDLWEEEYLSHEKEKEPVDERAEQSLI